MVGFLERLVQEQRSRQWYLTNAVRCKIGVNAVGRRYLFGAEGPGAEAGMLPTVICGMD